MKEKYIYTSPDGQTFNLNNDTDKFVYSVTGLGLSPAEFGTVTGPFQHGASLLNIKLTPRTVRMVIRHNGCDRDAYWQIRENLVDMLRYSRTSCATAFIEMALWFTGQLIVFSQKGWFLSQSRWIVGTVSVSKRAWLLPVSILWSTIQPI